MTLYVLNLYFAVHSLYGHWLIWSVVSIKFMYPWRKAISFARLVPSTAVRSMVMVYQPEFMTINFNKLIKFIDGTVSSMFQVYAFADALCEGLEGWKVGSRLLVWIWSFYHRCDITTLSIYIVHNLIWRLDATGYRFTIFAEHTSFVGHSILNLSIWAFTYQFNTIKMYLFQCTLCALLSVNSWNLHESSPRDIEWVVCGIRELSHTMILFEICAYHIVFFL